jgi:NADPH:quinone reductase-like Zn-dependent oxidoreductase
VKALRFHEYGGRDKLVVESVPDPVAGPGEVVVKVGACALNHLDVDFREGISRFPLELPLIMGLELAGTIVSRGEGVSEEWKVGDRVAPYLMGTDPASVFTRTGRENLAPQAFIGSTMPGGYAEYAAIPERHLVRTPDSMTDVEAAAFQIAFGTSYHMLFTRGELTMGETVLINSVGSGIGSAAVQLAKLAGAYVIGNASSDEKLAKARELGMHEGINHATHDVAAEVMRITGGRGVDLVYEHVGGKLFQAGLDSLTRDGRLVTCGAHSGEVVDLDIIVLFRNQTRIIGSFTFTSAEYEEVLRLAGLGLLTPQVHSTYSLDDAAEAFEVMEARRHFGKIVITP